jgi:hypothetical protein
MTQGLITQVTVQATRTQAINLAGSNRTVIRCSGNTVRIGYQENDLSDASARYFEIKSGECFVFDANNLTGNTNPELGSLLYATVNSGDDAVLQIWLQGGVY